MEPTIETQETVTPAQQSAPAPVEERRRMPLVWWGLGVGLAAAILMVVLAITTQTDAVTAIVIAAFAYFFVASLFLWDNCAVVNVIAWFATRSISFPGLIWEFSIDGFMWLIGMKLLFWLLGALFGLLCFVVGILVGILISPIAYFFGLHEYLG